MSQLAKEHLTAEAALNFSNLEIKSWGPQPDYEVVTSLLNQSMSADKVKHRALTAEMENYYSKLPEFSPSEDAFFAMVDGEPIAWVSLQPRLESEGDQIYRHYVALPEASRGMGLRAALINLVEKRAVERAADLPAGQTSWLEASFSSNQGQAIALIKAKGYQPVRYFFFMTRSLAEPIKDQPMPAGFYQRPLTEADYRAIWQANQQAFSEHWGHAETTEQHFQMFLEDPLTNPDLWQIAWHDEQVAGMVLNFLDEQENEEFNRLRGYTEDIAVLKPFRRRGLAKALISKSMKMFKEMGMEETALGVDTDNQTGALELYQSLGYETERKMTVYRKQLS